MATRFNDGMANRQADSIATAFEGGTGVLEIRTGSQPASGNDVASGTLLATITLPSDAWGAASGGVASKTGTWSVAATAGGTAGWGRFRNAGDTLRMDASITASGGGGDLIIDNTTVTNGGTVTVTAHTITQPLT